MCFVLLYCRVACAAVLFWCCVVVPLCSCGAVLVCFMLLYCCAVVPLCCCVLLLFCRVAFCCCTAAIVLLCCWCCDVVLLCCCAAVLVCCGAAVLHGGRVCVCVCVSLLGHVRGRGDRLTSGQTAWTASTDRTEGTGSGMFLLPSFGLLRLDLQGTSHFVRQPGIGVHMSTLAQGAHHQEAGPQG